MTDEKLTVMAIVEAKTEQREFVENEIKNLIMTTRAEEGNISYYLHQDNNNQNIFVLYETWENRELWQKHMNAPHMTRYSDVTKDATVKWTLYELTRL